MPSASNPLRRASRDTIMPYSSAPQPTPHVPGPALDLADGQGSLITIAVPVETEGVDQQHKCRYGVGRTRTTATLSGIHGTLTERDWRRFLEQATHVDGQ